MESSSQGSSADVENIQHACPTPSSTQIPWEFSHLNPSTARASTSELPEGDKRDQLPPKPPTPLPWVWECHWCNKRYNLGVTNRCLYDGHFVCSGFLNRRNNPQRNRRKQFRGVCKYGFDYPGWQAMKIWQWQVRHADGNEEQWESGCVRDCISPGDCLYRTTVALTPCSFGNPNNSPGSSNRAADSNQQDPDDAKNTFLAGPKEQN
ncbi:hypothetical protein AJ78_02684 [Emergomyces pasteurianus Ep9510]|uniref:Uncharacterized protein n=1 Tax=Emergomyces pasteurianus Ep9510 TaxID=1447872 RepID=A0A1J9QLY7_9EURO|nr:hypothetical protein AJ78_02684 [Emergomyces pasteurianus Ep9510]